MAVFRILHVSDLHIGARPQRIGIADLRQSQARGLSVSKISRASSHQPDLLDAVAAYAYENRKDLDAIVLTGDLATTGGKGDLAAAHAFVHTTPTVEWRYPAPGPDEYPTLKAAGLPTYVIPGNHDRFAGLTFAPGGAKFDEVFKKDWTAGQSTQVFGPLAAKSGSQLVFIGADLTLRKKDRGQRKRSTGYLGQGRAYQQVVDSLSARTRANEETAVVIWLVHFPFECTHVEKGLQLLDEWRISNAAAGRQVAATLAGHLHLEPCEHFTSSRIFVGGTAAQYVAPKGNFIQVLEIDLSGLTVNNIDYKPLRWDEELQTFA